VIATVGLLTYAVSCHRVLVLFQRRYPLLCGVVLIRGLARAYPFERRRKEHEQQGEHMTLDQVVGEVRERDKRDRERNVSPLIRAKDAVLVDNTAMDIEETARLIVMLARERESELTRTAGGKGNA
jgi:hypothetical protein